MSKKTINYLIIGIVLFSLSISIASADKPGTCKNPSGGNYCDKKSAVSNCYCDKACTNAQDCCTDYKEVCLGSGGGGGGSSGGTEKSFRYATWQCYDGYSEKQGSPSSCKTYQVWKSYADESCEGRCYPDGSKCGVNSFGVDTECTYTIKPICGNNICEEGEADYSYCPPCVYNEVNPCKAPCEFKPGTCQQDCQQITTFTLENYPNMFIKDNKFNGILVVGNKAPAEHVIAVSDIISSLKSSGIVLGIGPAKLDSEVSSLNQNIISVGTSCANNITGAIEGYPQDCNAGLQPNLGLIKIYSNNGYAHLVVKGYSDVDTRKTAEVLANYKNYKLSGTEYIVNILSTIQCTDSDGGIDYYKKGFMKDGDNDLGQWDSCYNEKQLVEYYCYKSGGKKVLYKCPNACEDGACISTTPPPEPITKQDVISWINSNCGEKG